MPGVPGVDLSLATLWVRKTEKGREVSFFFVFVFLRKKAETESKAEQGL